MLLLNLHPVVHSGSPLLYACVLIACILLQMQPLPLQWTVLHTSSWFSVVLSLSGFKIWVEHQSVLSCMCVKGCFFCNSACCYSWQSNGGDSLLAFTFILLGIERQSRLKIYLKAQWLCSSGFIPCTIHFKLLKCIIHFLIFFLLFSKLENGLHVHVYWPVAGSVVFHTEHFRDLYKEYKLVSAATGWGWQCIIPSGFCSSVLPWFTLYAFNNPWKRTFDL